MILYCQLLTSLKEECRAIEEVISNIKNNKFDINPKIDGEKNIGCDFCKFRDICFVKKRDKVNIVEEEFGGDLDGLD